MDAAAASRKVWKSLCERSEKFVKEDSVFRYESDVVQAAIRTGPNRSGEKMFPCSESDARGRVSFLSFLNFVVGFARFSMGVGECSCTETGVSD